MGFSMHFRSEQYFIVCSNVLDMGETYFYEIYYCTTLVLPIVHALPSPMGILSILFIIPLSAGIPVKSHSQFIPNYTGQQCNLEEAVRFEPNPPRAV